MCLIGRASVVGGWLTCVARRQITLFSVIMHNVRDISIILLWCVASCWCAVMVVGSVL